MLSIKKYIGRNSEGLGRVCVSLEEKISWWMPPGFAGPRRGGIHQLGLYTLFPKKVIFNITIKIFTKRLLFL